MSGDARERATRSARTIHAPGDTRHFMRVGPAGRRVRVLHEGMVLADSCGASRVLETGRHLYEPVLYLPRADVSAALVAADRARTYCPLKGHASYYDLVDGDGAVMVPEVAWSYEEALDHAAEIEGLVAFYGAKVTIEETPLPA